MKYKQFNGTFWGAVFLLFCIYDLMDSRPINVEVQQKSTNGEVRAEGTIGNANIPATYDSEDKGCRIRGQNTQKSCDHRKSNKNVEMKSETILSNIAEMHLNIEKEKSAGWMMTKKPIPNRNYSNAEKKKKTFHGKEISSCISPQGRNCNIHGNISLKNSKTSKRVSPDFQGKKKIIVHNRPEMKKKQKIKKSLPVYKLTQNAKSSKSKGQTEKKKKTVSKKEKQKFRICLRLPTNRTAGTNKDLFSTAATSEERGMTAAGTEKVRSICRFVGTTETKHKTATIINYFSSKLYIDVGSTETFISPSIVSSYLGAIKGEETISPTSDVLTTDTISDGSDIATGSLTSPYLTQSSDTTSAENEDTTGTVNSTLSTTSTEHRRKETVPHGNSMKQIKKGPIGTLISSSSVGSFPSTFSGKATSSTETILPTSDLISTGTGNEESEMTIETLTQRYSDTPNAVSEDTTGTVYSTISTTSTENKGKEIIPDGTSIKQIEEESSETLISSSSVHSSPTTFSDKGTSSTETILPTSDLISTGTASEGNKMTTGTLTSLSSTQRSSDTPNAESEDTTGTIYSTISTTSTENKRKEIVAHGTSIKQIEEKATETLISSSSVRSSPSTFSDKTTSSTETILPSSDLISTGTASGRGTPSTSSDKATSTTETILPTSDLISTGTASERGTPSTSSDKATSTTETILPPSDLISTGTASGRGTPSTSSDKAKSTTETILPTSDLISTGTASEGNKMTTGTLTSLSSEQRSSDTSTINTTSTEHKGKEIIPPGTSIKQTEEEATKTLISSSSVRSSPSISSDKTTSSTETILPISDLILTGTASEGNKMTTGILTSLSSTERSSDTTNVESEDTTGTVYSTIGRTSIKRMRRQNAHHGNNMKQTEEGPTEIFISSWSVGSSLTVFSGESTSSMETVSPYSDFISTGTVSKGSEMTTETLTSSSTIQRSSDPIMPRVKIELE